MEIDPKNKNKKISIAKLPRFLGNFILDLKQRTEIGEINIDNGKISLSINNKLDKSEVPIPLDYNIKQVDRSTSEMYILSNTQDSSVIEGEVDNELIITPVINQRYINFKKNGLGKPTKTTEVIDSLNEGVRVERMGNLREMDYLARKRKQMLIDKKRERLDKDEVMNIIFNAFEKYDSWTVRDLADFTGQPTAFIQEIVNEICNVDKKEHKSSYTLKDEYK